MANATETETVEDVDLPENILQDIAEDEARWAKDDAKPRDAQGRFASNEQPSAEGEGADDADIAGAETGKETAAEQGQPTGKQSTEAEKALPKGEQQQTDPKADPKAGQNEQAGKSRYAQDQARRNGSWEEINKSKAQIAAEREQLTLEREQFAAQQQTSSSVARDETGKSATDWEGFSSKFAQRSTQRAQLALQAEQAGDFEKADQLNGLAANDADLAKKAGERAAALKGAGTSAVWEKLKADLPEAMQFDGPLNKELRAALRSDAQMKADPIGPYRLAIRAQRKVVQAAEQRAVTAEKEAARVPELTKRIEALTAQVEDLTRKTSLPGGGANLTRGGSPQNWADKSTADMERELDQELAAMR